MVLDELHMIDDDYRGYLLELMATKLLCLSQPIQIVGMSATLTVSISLDISTSISVTDNLRILTFSRPGCKVILMRRIIDLSP